MRAHYRTPDWFTRAKFGIFIHWGIYAIPAYNNEWYARHMYGEFAPWHTEHYGPPDQFGYKDFIPLLKARRYDPESWAALFKQSGAKCVVPVADGFAMWDSSLTDWPSRMGIGSSICLDGGVPRVVLTTPHQDYHPFSSLSARWVYFQPDHKNLYRVPGPAQDWRKADPGKITDFPESGLFLEDPQLSRDGKQLLYSRGKITAISASARQLSIDQGQSVETARPQANFSHVS